MSLSTSQAEKIKRIERLARDGATEGERAAARETLKRIEAKQLMMFTEMLLKFIYEFPMQMKDE